MLRPWSLIVKTLKDKFTQRWLQHSPKQLKLARMAYSRQSLGAPDIPNWFDRKLFTPIFKAKIITVAAKLKALARMTSELHVKGFK